MNKKRVDSWIPVAREALAVCGVLTADGTVGRACRGQMSVFGAMVLTGSLRAAVANFCDASNAGRPQLLSAIYYCLSGQKTDPQQVLEILCKQDSPALKEQFLDACIAVRLALGLYEVR